MFTPTRRTHPPTHPPPDYPVYNFDDGWDRGSDCAAAPGNEGCAAMGDPAWGVDCVGRTLSSYDALTHRACAAVTAGSPIVVPVDRLLDALDNALDTIAAFSLKNPVWAKEANKTGVPVRAFRDLPLGHSTGVARKRY